MIWCTGSNVSPVDLKWQAISEMQLSHLAQISPLLLATAWLFFFFFLYHHFHLFLTHSLSLSFSVLPGNHARKCDPTCLRLADGTADPWAREKRGRHACFTQRKCKLIKYSFLENKPLLTGQYLQLIVPFACPFNRLSHARVLMRVLCAITNACHAQRSACMTHAWELTCMHVRIACVDGSICLCAWD